MTFRAFNKHLSDEIENLFETLGDDHLPAEAQRLDTSISIDEMIERIKNLDHSKQEDEE